MKDASFVTGVDEARTRVSRYVQGIVDSSETEGDVTFRCFRYGIGGDANNALCESDYSFDMGSIGPVVEEIVDAAVAEALETGTGHTLTKFRVVAVRNGKVIVKKETFSLTTPESEDEPGFLEELPTKDGVTALLMRHQEGVYKLAVNGSQKAIESLQRENRELREQNAALMRQGMESWKLFQDLVDAKQARDLEFRRFEAEEKRKEQVAGMLVQGAPLLLQRFVTGPAQGAASPMEGMLDGLLSTFTRDQIALMAQTGRIELDPMQRAAMLEIAMAFVTKKEAAEKAASATQSPSTVNGQAS